MTAEAVYARPSWSGAFAVISQYTRTVLDIARLQHARLRAIALPLIAGKCYHFDLQALRVGGTERYNVCGHRPPALTPDITTISFYYAPSVTQIWQTHLSQPTGGRASCCIR